MFLSRFHLAAEKETFLKLCSILCPGLQQETSLPRAFQLPYCCEELPSSGLDVTMPGAVPLQAVLALGNCSFCVKPQELSSSNRAVEAWFIDGKCYSLFSKSGCFWERQTCCRGDEQTWQCCLPKDSRDTVIPIEHL